mmetsp:Transcript_93743/g.183802  ORF Transcript_93743/g.183802 Transcript_93743/m.183802 type:complete len:176 (-) Transcript_93743:29-556(-)
MEEWDLNRKVDESKYDSTELPTYPVRTFVGHVAMKGVQAGSILGLAIGVPLIAYLRKMPISKAWLKVMPIAPIIGTIGSLSLLYGKNATTPFGSDGIDDRAFRIMHNKGQVKVDKYSVVGSVLGMGCATVMAPGIGPIFAAASTGVAVGCAYYKIDSLGLLDSVASQLEQMKKET